MRFLLIDEDAQRTSSELSGLRGLAERERGRTDVAREWLERALEIGRAHPNALEALAELRDTAGNEVSAEELRALARERRALTK
jgi:Tfp pilus assembly protein PilF